MLLTYPKEMDSQGKMPSVKSLHLSLEELKCIFWGLWQGEQEKESYSVGKKRETNGKL